MSRIRGRPRQPRPWRDDISRVEVKSCSNGNLQVIVGWKKEPVDETAAPVGVMTRLAFAEFCQLALNEALANDYGPAGPVRQGTNNSTGPNE